MADGRFKLRCPARNGTLGCPRVPGTVAAALESGLPVGTPPDDADALSICSHDTVTLRVSTPAQATALKFAQKHYWGSREWRQSHDRRTYVEGWFGVLKSANGSRAQRGNHEFRGLALVTVVTTCIASLNNMRLLRAWHTRTTAGDTNHPLLQPDQPFHGCAHLTAEQAAILDEAAANRAA